MADNLLRDDLTNAEIAHILQWTIKRAIPRTNVLMKIGFVLDAERWTCKITGSTARAWKAKYPALPPAFKDVGTTTQTPLFTE